MKRIVRVGAYERDCIAHDEAGDELEDVGTFTALEEEGEMSFISAHDAEYFDERTAAVLALGEECLTLAKNSDGYVCTNKSPAVMAALAADAATPDASGHP